MSEIRSIGLIGAGNVAWHLGPVLENAGYSVRSVYSLHRRNAENLVKRLYHAEVKDDFDYSGADYDLLIIAVKDEVIENIATELIISENTRVVHTSGTQPLSLLGYLGTDQIGVFYPLQTFSKTKPVEFADIPVCIEAENLILHEELMNLAKKITRKVWYVNTNDRKLLHIAAVFACNFTNHLYLKAKQLLQRQGLDFEMLHPLIVETVHKAIEVGPENAQTGPAIRQDYEIIDTQQSYLGFDEKLQELYSSLTKSIIHSIEKDEYPEG